MRTGGAVGSVSAALAASVLGAAAEGDLPAQGFTALACRLEEVIPGALYFGFEEFLEYNCWIDGGARVDEAIARGACGLVLKEASKREGAFVEWTVRSPRRAFAALAREAYARPDDGLMLVGVTGTNGKTTSTALIGHLAGAVGTPAGWMGTLGCHCGSEWVEAMDYTTDLAHASMRRLNRLRASGATLAAMEVSSHALALDRVAGFRFRAGVFLNLTQDHLDFHGDAVAYRNAKQQLFAGLERTAVAVLNRDDPHWEAFASATSAQIFTYGIEAAGADLRARVIGASPGGLQFSFTWAGEDYTVRAPLSGRFQVENLLAALGTLLALGYPPKTLCAAATIFPGVPGRMESVALPNGSTAIIDYAHNPGGLQRLLQACSELKARRLILVFGCGGDRDRGKRPIMGRIAEAADQVFVTSDNPRTEDPRLIIDEILRGFGMPGKASVLVDRRDAIAAACSEAQAGDLVVIAGKGHEDYQIVGTQKEAFSDRAEVENWIRKKL